MSFGTLYRAFLLWFTLNNDKNALLTSSFSNSYLLLIIVLIVSIKSAILALFDCFFDYKHSEIA